MTTNLILRPETQHAPHCRYDPAMMCDSLLFERIMSELSTSFINVPTDQIGNEIVKGLKEIVQYSGAAAATLVEFSEGPPVQPSTVHLWHVTDIPPLSESELMQNLSWGMESTRTGQILEHRHLCDIPEEGARDRALFERLGFKSTVALPVMVGGRVIAVLGVFAHSEHSKLCDLVPRLRVIIQAFGNALSRKRTEEALHRAIAELKALKNRLEVDNLYLQQEIKVERNFGSFVGESEALKIVWKKIQQVCFSRATVLIAGETGTGKELVARAIHELSPRGQRPLVRVNCGALPATLIESELFGHEKGAFTGAFSRNIGRFEFADKSSIFLDEIGELPLELQTKLLRVLQEGEIQRLGSSETRKVDVRIIAATNRDLQTLVAEKKFREDLFYRLNVFPIHVPPLRDRREDIPALVRYFVEMFAAKSGKQIESISQKTMAALMEYGWPGNVRELQNILERAVLVSTTNRLELDDCSWVQGLPASVATVGSPLRGLHDEEREYILKVLRLTGWRVSGEKGAAKILHLNPKTLESKMKRLNITRPT